MALALFGEHWLPAYQWPAYEVSNLGRVARRLPGQGAVVGRILKPAAGGGGERVYLQVYLRRAGEAKTQLVHRLVALAWLGGPHPGMVVHHINADRQDNRLDNLEWVTQSDNIQAYWSGLPLPPPPPNPDDDLPF